MNTLRKSRNVFINSPSGEGGRWRWRVWYGDSYFVFINSPSGEGGGSEALEKIKEVLTKMFSLILLQAKAGGAMVLNHDTARFSIPPIYASLRLKNQHGSFCQNDDPQILAQ